MWTGVAKTELDRECMLMPLCMLASQGLLAHRGHCGVHVRFTRSPRERGCGHRTHSQPAAVSCTWQRGEVGVVLEASRMV